MNPRRALSAVLPIVLLSLGLAAGGAAGAPADTPHNVNASAFGCISSPPVQATHLCPPGAPPIVSAGWWGTLFAMGASSNGTVYEQDTGSVYGVTRPLQAPIVSMALDYGDPGTGSAPPSWLVGSDGSVFALAGATFFGSMGGQALNAPMVGMAETYSGLGIPGGFGKGYWLVAADGGVFAFGDATFHGSLGNMALNAPIVAIANTSGGLGYLLFGRDGGVFSFGNAPFVGSFLGAPSPIVSGFFATTIGPNPPGPPAFYCVAASSGQLYCDAYGNI